MVDLVVAQEHITVLQPVELELAEKVTTVALVNPFVVPQVVVVAQVVQAAQEPVRTQVPLAVLPVVAFPAVSPELQPFMRPVEQVTPTKLPDLLAVLAELQQEQVESLVQVQAVAVAVVEPTEALGKLLATAVAALSS
jgi:hypothetical protein